MAGEQVPGLVWIPAGQIDRRAVLKRVANRMKHVGLDPERIAGFASPQTQTFRAGDELACRPFNNHSARRVRISRLRTFDASEDVALLPVRVTLAERQAPGDVLDRIAIEVHLELVQTLRVVSGRRDGAGDRVAHVDDEDGAHNASEHIEVRDIEPNVLARDR